MGRPIGIMLGFEISQNPFIGRPSWKEVEALPFPEKLKHPAHPRVPRAACSPNRPRTQC